MGFGNSRAGTLLASAAVPYQLRFQLDVSNLALSCYLQLWFFNRLWLSAGRYKSPAIAKPFSVGCNFF